MSLPRLFCSFSTCSSILSQFQCHLFDEYSNEVMLNLGDDEVSGDHSSLTFMMKVMIWRFVSDTHMVMVVLTLPELTQCLPSVCNSWVFFAISQICMLVTHTWTSVPGHDLLSCLCSIPGKVMVWYFVSDAHKVMTTLFLVVLVFAGTDIMVTFKILVRSFLCSLTDTSTPWNPLQAFVACDLNPSWG
jgi:hypothetical protein